MTTKRKLYWAGLLISFSIFIAGAWTLKAALVYASQTGFKTRSTEAAKSAVGYKAAPLDANDLLVLRFDNSLNGEGGETPTTATGTSFQAGVQNQGVLLPNPNQLFYNVASNINATEGSFECWLKPTWNGNDGQGHFILQYGSGGGIVIGKDGANNMRIILNRFGTFPGGEVGVAFNVGSWVANQWHHIAFTWSNTSKQLAVYIDGTVKSQTSFAINLPSIASSTFQIGGDGAGSYIQAVVDDLRISNVARTPQEISNRMLEGLTITSWSLNPTTTNVELWPTWYWWITPTIIANTNIGTLSLPVLAASWASSNPSAAILEISTGRFKALAPGSAVMTGTLNSTQNSFTINVVAPVLPPVEETIDPVLATPANGYLYRMPVVIIRFFPTLDGVNLDAAETGITSTLAALKANEELIERRHKFMLEEGSKFRGYSTPSAPSLGYQVIKVITVYEPIPPGFDAGGGVYFPDYNQILNRFGGDNLVNNLGVKEFWIPHYHHGRIVPNESNMSSPTTGDISNSYRSNGDQPIYNKTYVTYGINFGRSQAEATHNHGHQLESILGHVNQLRDGNTTLWWSLFARAANNPPARCGNTHFPPNALSDYDYTNLNPVASDILNWQPAGGPTTMVNANTWGNVPYPWPGGTSPPQEVESKWYIFWMQSFAGLNNNIPYNTNKLTNWWAFTGDWDKAIQAGIGLHEPGNCNYTLSATSQNVIAAGETVNVNVTSPSGCKWFASSNDTWITITSGGTGNGNGTVGISVAANTGNVRTGTVAIAGQLFTIIQDGNSVTGLQFYPLAHPVRLLDTRPGASGCDAPGAMIISGTSRTQTAAGRTCDGLTIPANAKALTGNVTTVESGGGYLTLYPSDAAQPFVANSNFTPNQILNNVFTVGLGAGDGAFKIFAVTNTNVVVDVTGYYAPPAVGGLYFHPLPKPIRLLETRVGEAGCFTPGAPLQGGMNATQLGITSCGGVTIPAGVQALVGNATTVGPQNGGYLTLYPADAAQPFVASSNFLTGNIMNAPFTVGLSPSGEFKIFTTVTTDLVIDVSGYYSTQLNDVNGQGLLFNSLAAPIRLLDTRAGETGCFTPGAPMAGGVTYTQPAVGACVNIPATAKAVVGNATTVNVVAGGFLTFWPSNAAQPLVATSNFLAGQIFNRHFIVGLGADGAFKRYSSAGTDLVIDMSGYFAP